MKVILTKDVPSLGKSGDIKQVSDGHARNFLIARNLALPATTAALTKLQKEEKEKQAKIAREQEKLLALKNKIQNQTLTLKAKADKEHLFAAIRENQIAKLINEFFKIEIDESQVILEKPIKNLGLHEAKIRFAENVVCTVKLNIENI